MLMHMAGKSFLMGICSCLLCNTAIHAQGTRDSAIRAAAIAHAVKEYRSYIGVAAPLYAGPKYTNYTQMVEKGQPFFINTSFHPGTIVFDNVYYDRLQLKLDVLTDRLILADPLGNSELCPDPEKITAFTILDHAFVKLNRDGAKNAPAAGYYEVLYSKKGITALKKESKILRQSLEGTTVTRYILTNYDYFIRKGNTYYSINRKGQLLDVLKDHKKELQDYINKQNLDFEEKKDEAIKATLLYYENLLNS